MPAISPPTWGVKSFTSMVSYPMANSRKDGVYRLQKCIQDAKFVKQGKHDVALKLKPQKVLAGDRLRAQIYEFVRGEMRLGLLAPGERLKEVELAERLGGSTQPGVRGGFPP